MVPLFGQDRTQPKIQIAAKSAFSDDADGAGERFVMRRVAAAIGLAIGTAGCTLLTEEGLVNVRGKFDSLTCPELVTRYDDTSKRERDFVEQMERAARDPIGPLVNTFVYSTPLAKERADLLRIREAAARIDCDLQARSPDSVLLPSPR